MKKTTYLAWPLALTLLLLAGCQPAEQDITLRFAARVGDEPMQCGQTFQEIGLGNALVKVRDFRFYVSDVRLIDANGVETPLQLAQDSTWQFQNLALLDFEDGSVDCENGTPQMNDRIVGKAPAGDYTGVAFSIGVPQDLNHIDATTAPSPLNVSTLFWTWRAGYIFNRIDLTYTAADSAGAWLMHLGSTGCESGAATMPPTTACSRPNRVDVRLDNFNLQEDVIIADAAALVRNIDLTTGTPAPPGCMSGTSDPDCPGMFANLGVDLESGQCVNGCRDQGYIRIAGEAERAQLALR